MVPWAACLLRILPRKGEAEIWAYDVWKDHVEAIRDNGLRISGAADFTAKLNATSDSRELPRCDYGIVATKAIHTRGAITQVAHAFDENSAVCSVQNGVGNEEIIAEQVKYVIRGTTFPAGHPIAPGHIGFDIKGDTWIGPFEPTKTPMSKVEELAGLITRSGMNVIALQGCPRRAVDETDLQRRHQSCRSSDAAASRCRHALWADGAAIQRSDR